MTINKKSERIYEFGPFRLEVAEYRLLRSSEVIPLSPKVFHTLLVLIENGGHVVSKDELISAVWPDSFVEDSSLTQNISLIRKSLGEREGEKFIETVPKCGYRFVAPVRVLSGAADDEMLKEDVIDEDTLTSAFRAPEEFGAAVERNSQSQPTASRPASRDDVPFHLSFSQKFMASLLTIFLFLAGGLYIWKTVKKGESSSVGTTTTGSLRSVAILPLRELGNESDNNHLGLGMADALIVKLSRFRRVNVLPTSTVFRYIGREYDVVKVGRELGVEAVLDGTFQRVGDRVRVSVMMVDVADGRTLWSEKFDERFTDIFALQDAISERVAVSLSLRLSEEEKKLLRERSTENLEAYQSYLTGLYFWNKRTKDGLLKAINFFQQAIGHDAAYAQAYAGLADSYSLRAYYGYEKAPAEVYGRARGLALKAIELNEPLAEAYVTLGMLSIVADSNPAKAGELYSRAIEINPNYSAAYVRCAWISLAQGNLARALEEMKRGQELDPVSPFTNTALGQMHYYQGSYDEAIRFSRKALELEPNTFLAQYILSVSYEQKGMYQSAIDEASKIKGNDSNGLATSDALEVLGHIHARAGRVSEARKILSELNQRLKQNSPDVSPLNIAMVHEALGERDKAFEWLERFLERDSLIPIIFHFDPRSASLRSDPRYYEILRARGIKQN